MSAEPTRDLDLGLVPLPMPEASPPALIERREISPELRSRLTVSPVRVSAGRTELIAELRRRSVSNPRYANWPSRVVGPLLGHLDGEGPVFYRLSGHRIVIGETGSGKGTSVILPMLLHDDGHAAVIIDPKDGAITRSSAAYRATLGPVHIIDPYGVSGLPAADQFNPLEALDPASPTLVEDAGLIANALCYDPKAMPSGETRYWDNQSRSFITGLILHLVTTQGERADFLRIREITTMSLDDFMDDIGQAMLNNPACEGTIARYASEFARNIGGHLKNFESVISNINSYINWSEYQALRKVYSRSTFSFEELRESCGTLYIVTPDDRLETAASWLRVLMQSARIALQRAKSKRPVHFVIDESAVFERFDLITTGLRAWRSSSIRLHLFFQRIDQIRKAFGDAQGVTDAEVIQFLGSNDLDTLEYFSRLIGERDMIVPTASNQTGWSTSEGTTTTEGTSSGRTKGKSSSASRASTKTFSENWAIAESKSTTEGTQASKSGGQSYTKSRSSGRGGSEGHSDTTARSYGTHGSTTHSSGDSSGTNWNSSEGVAEGHNAGWSNGSSTGKTEGETATKGNSKAHAEGLTEGETANEGTSETETRSEATTRNVGQSGGESRSYTVQLRRTLRPEQIRQMPEEQMIVIAGNREAAILSPEHFFNNPVLVERALGNKPTH